MISRKTLAQFGEGGKAPGRPNLTARLLIWKRIWPSMASMPSMASTVIRRKPWHSHRASSILELEYCPFNRHHIGGSAAFTLADGVPGFTCKHNGCGGKTIEYVFKYFPEPAPHADAADEWPDPAPISGSLLNAEPFVEELLPASFRAHVTDVAERMQAPPDFPGQPRRFVLLEQLTAAP